MESGDGGAEEKSDRSKNTETEPSQPGQIDQKLHSGSDSDVSSKSENASQQILNLDVVEVEEEEESIAKFGINADINKTEQVAGDSEKTSLAIAQEVPRGESVQTRYQSDEESGENVMSPEAKSSDRSCSSERSTAASVKNMRDDDGLVSNIENLTASSDAGGDASAKDNTTEESSQIRDADGTVKALAASSSSSSSTASTAMGVTDISVELGHSPKATGQSNGASQVQGGEEAGVDEELDNFFQSARPKVGKFPALDNVDLASDEDGHEGGAGRDTETPDNSPAQGDQENHPNGSDEARPGSGSPTENDGDSLHSETKSSARADYPLKQGCYKVCRELEPGVKQCLILETGEEVVCVTEPMAKAGFGGKGEGESSTSSVTSALGGDPFSSSSPRTVVIKRNNSNSGEAALVAGEDGAATTMLATIVSPSEAFAYVSFEAGGTAGATHLPKLISEDRGDGEDGIGLSMGHHFLLDENQQAFITENGIPVILDNAEDDVKLGLQQAALGQWSRVGDGGGGGSGSSHEACLSPSSLSAAVAPERGEEDVGVVLESEAVADVLSSGGDCDSGGNLLQDSKQAKKSKKKRDKKQRFYELQPDSVSDEVAEVETDTILNRSNNSSNSGFDRCQNEADADGEDVNNNALERDCVGDDVYSGMMDSRRLRLPYGSSSDYESSHRHMRASNYSGASSRDYSSASSRRAALNEGSRQLSSGGDSSYSRHRDRLPLDSSHLSTRFSRLDRGEPSHPGSSTEESLTIPRFRTLHDQQVSWLEMFKMIEDQHRNDLQSQYSEHQRILRDMQAKMERELIKQQDTLKHRLQTHKEILQELSPRNQGYQRRDLPANSNRRHDDPYDDASHTTIDGTAVTLKFPPPLSGRLGESYDQVPVKRSLNKELSSPARPADTSLNLTDTSTSLSGEKLLRGGVYSSPMPLAKARQKKAKGGRAYENKSLNSAGDRGGQTTSSSYADQIPTSYSEGRPQDTSLTESDDVMSPRSRVSLREKHAKHVADLRAYYEEELKEMRQMLTSRQNGDDPTRESGDSSLTGGDRILANENTELRQRCQELDDECHDLKIEIRELQQKIQGLEIRASDYAERYTNSQSQVRSLHARLEELTEFAKEKEAVASDLKAKQKTDGDALQNAYKKEKELGDSLHAAKTTIQRLVEKYESLEKDQQLLKGTLAEKDEKLFATRKEAMDTSNKLSRMELENKQLLHEKDVLKHELTMARSSVASMHTCFEEAFQATGPGSSTRTSRNNSVGLRSRSSERSSMRSSSRDRNALRPDDLPDSETEHEFSKSPIMRAERELKKLRESVGTSQEFAPKLQRKFYGTETPHGANGLRGSSTLSPGRSGTKSASKSSTSPKDKRGRTESHVNGVKNAVGSSHPSAPASNQNRRDNISTKTRDSERITESQPSADRSVQGTLKRLGIENGWNSDKALERIKAGDVVSRPGWEDIHTSMARGGGGNKASSSAKSNQTRDQMLRERLQNIDMLERKYDDLSNEKRKFESALSKVPAHGPRRERERLEAELDRVDRELGSVRMSLKRFHVLKSTI